MARKSGNLGRKTTFHIENTASPVTALSLEQQKMASEEQGVSVSLKYYRQATQCFSQWSPDNLRKFSNTIAKVKQMSAASLKAHPICCRHRNKPKAERYALPAELSADLPFFELRVAPGNAVRVHGVFIGSVFHLVWLDRADEVFPDLK